MFTNPSLIQKGNGAAEAKNQEIVLMRVEDIKSFPLRNDNGVALIGNYIMKPGKYVTKLNVTASKTSLPLASEGEEDNISVSSLPEFYFPGSTLEFEEWSQNNLNKAMIVGVRIGSCGDPDAFYRMYGSCSAPLTFMPEGQNDNDATLMMVKFQQFAKTRFLPSRYFGTFTLATTNSVDADATTVDVAEGTGEYQLQDNTVATVIDAISNAVAGIKYTILGSGGNNPATIESSNANFLLAGAIDWQGLSGTSITLEAVDAHGGGHVFIERSRN